MSAPSVRTVELHGWLDRIKAGDPNALNTLLERVSRRLERLARKMIKRFPRIARWADAEDVLQNASLRLIRALAEVRPGSMRDFYALASIQIRRELLDTTKKLYGPEGEGANLVAIDPDDSAVKRRLDPPANVDDERELEKWRQFHEEVERLPPDEREVVGLIFYQGWKQDQVAELFGVSVRTVQRWWQKALEKLQSLLSEWPVS
jgi:RNA polymerase sigma factor (sigma-70 family)